MVRGTTDRRRSLFQLTKQRCRFLRRSLALDGAPKLFEELRKPVAVSVELLLHTIALTHIRRLGLEECQGEERRCRFHKIFDIAC